MKVFNLKENQKGITLIALVVTIIILLILAGVAIGFAVNGSGLFDKAKQATDKYNNSVDRDNAELGNLYNEIDLATKGGEIWAQDVEFKPSDPNWKAKDGSNIINVKQALDYLLDS